MNKRVKMILLCFCTVLVLTLEAWSEIRPARMQRSIENTKALEEKKLKLFVKETVEEEILGFQCQDYDNDGEWEAFFLTDKQKEEEISILCDLWYTDGKHREKLMEDIWIYLESMEVWDLKECKIFKVEGRGNGNHTQSFAWRVKNKLPDQLDNTFSGLSYEGGNDFSVYWEAYDLYKDGTGHTWKRYYFFWDGTGLREYGGIPITKKELLEVKGTKEVISSLERDGCIITDIFYRKNGILHVNYTKGQRQDNLTFVLEGDGAGLAKDASYGGRYEAALSPAIADYPENFQMIKRDF